MPFILSLPNPCLLPPPPEYSPAAAIVFHNSTKFSRWTMKERKIPGFNFAWCIKLRTKSHSSCKFKTWLWTMWSKFTAHWAHIIVFRCLSLKHSLLNPMWTHTHQISTTLVPISQQHSQLSDWHTKLSSCKFYGPTYVRNLKLSILITATRTSASLFYRRCGDWLREAQRRRKERKLLEQLNG